MATLGDLVIKLSMDAAGFESDMGKAAYEAEKRMAQIVAAGVLAGNAMTKLADLALQAVSKVGTLAIDIAKSVQAQADALGEASQAAGLTAQSYQALSSAAALAGVSSEAFGSAMSKLNKAIVEAAEGQPKMEAAFKRLGVAATDADGNLRSTEDVFNDLNRAFQDFPEGPLKAALAIEIFGKAGAKLIPAMNSDMQELAKSAQEVGAIMSGELLAASDQYEAAQARLQQSIDGVRNTIAEGMLPVMTTFMTAMDDLARSLLGAKDRAEAVIAIRENMTAFLKEAAYYTAFAVDVFASLRDIVKEVVEAVALLGITFVASQEIIVNALKLNVEGVRQGVREIRAAIDVFIENTQERLNRQPLRVKVEAAFADAEKKTDEARFQAQLPQSPAYRDEAQHVERRSKKVKDAAAKELREREAAEHRLRALEDRNAEEAKRIHMKELNEMIKGWDEEARATEKAAREAEREAEKERRRKQKVADEAEKDRQKNFDAIVKERQQYADIFEGGLANAFVDIVQGTKSVSQAFLDMSKSIVESIEKIIAKKLATALFESLFGSETSGEGGFGQIMASIIGGYFGASAGTGGVGASEGVMIQRQHGGPVSAGQMVMVGERGPETFRAGYSGRIDPVSNGETVHNNVSVAVNVPQTTDRRSADQIAAAAGLAVQRAMRRTQ